MGHAQHSAQILDPSEPLTQRIGQGHRHGDLGSHELRLSDPLERSADLIVSYRSRADRLEVFGAIHVLQRSCRLVTDQFETKFFGLEPERFDLFFARALPIL